VPNSEQGKFFPKQGSKPEVKKTKMCSHEMVHERRNKKEKLNELMSDDVQGV
jgi:hypothetical protein